jgi:beta-galactosidase
MKKKVVRGICMLSTLIYSHQLCAKRIVKTFNNDWKFKRYGTMPGGSYHLEPGGSKENYTLISSGDALEQNGQVSNIADNDPSTCWNSQGPKNEWVGVKYKTKKKVAAIYLQWGFAGAPDISVHAMINGEWKVIKQIKDNTRSNDIKVSFPATVSDQFKVSLDKMPPNSWPRIATMTLFDENDNKIAYDFTYNKETPLQKDSVNFKNWESVTLPHDWAIKGPFDKNLDHGTGLLPWKGIGWYKKTFKAPKTWANKRIFLDFDGAMANSKVYLNGKLIGGWPYGYNSFRVDLNKNLKAGEENIISVRLDTEHWGSRWYPGAGIYRNTWLVISDNVRIDHWGASIVTTIDSKNNANSKFSIDLKNDSNKSFQGKLEVNIKDADGKIVSSKNLELSITEKNATQKKFDITFPNPKLWSPETPNLYDAEILVKNIKGKVLDNKTFKIGVRSFKFDPKNGFFLNGKKYPIKGVCLHHDLGPLGAAVNINAIRRQLEIMKEMGCNAIRTTHNPPTPELLDLCDSMGFLAIDEAFDCWKRGKREFDYSVLFDEWHKKDLEAMIKRDRNHPSIIMWSLGNEVPDQHNAKMAQMLTDIVHAIDNTRPTTLGTNDGKVGLSDVSQSLDVMGYNYNLWAYGEFFKRDENKNTPLIASETSSCISSRGEYFFPVDKVKRADFQVTSYDIDAPGWGCTPDKQFEVLEKFPAVAGEFVWTGFDYIGEPTPYNDDATVLLNFSSEKERKEQEEALKKLGKIKVPSRSSYFGIVDLCGFPKDRYYIYKSQWRPNVPTAHILPHWNWSKRIGEITPVHVYTSGDEAELFLNGKSLGKKKKGEFEYRLKWEDVKYQPGELKVITYKNGKEWATDTVVTTDKPQAIEVIPSKKSLKADGQDLIFVTIKVIDKNGNMVPTANIDLEYKIEGSAEIAGAGNGNSASNISFASLKQKTYNGLALVIIKNTKRHKGSAKLTVKSPLGTQTINIESK